MARSAPQFAWHQAQGPQVTPRDLERVQTNVRDALAALPASFTFVDRAPETSDSPGTSGQVFMDRDYLYLCVAKDTWRRVALGSF